MQTNQTIPIFYACDNNFVKYTMVSLCSMIENADPSRRYRVHILHTDITPEMQERVEALLQNAPHFSLLFDDVSEYLSSPAGKKLPIRDYYSKTTYYRLYIAEMFPHIDKAIYIDSDTVVTGDISKLYDYNIENYDLGACHEQAMIQVEAYGNYVEGCLGIDRNAYFNAGVLLINCRRFREKKVLQRFTELLGVYRFAVTQDEDYLNVICKDHVRFLPDTWNAEVFGQMRVTRETGNIFHYIMVSKPWHYADCRFGDLFWDYAEKTDAYEELQEILASYTDEQKENDARSVERLEQLAVKETERPDNYLKRLNAQRDPGRLAVLGRIDELIREGKFDVDAEDDPPARQIRPGEVDYLCKKPINKLLFQVSYSRARHFLNGLIDREELVIKDIVGLKNFQTLTTGAVITCNHFNAFDSFAIQMAYENSGQKKRKKGFYRVIREGNYTSFPGFYGFLMRHHHTLPLSSNHKTMKEFLTATDTLLKEGHFVLVYPEQSMWWNYRKPKPLKEGAFHFAAKSRVPVLPCFITMRDSQKIGQDGFPIQEYTIHISPPIYPSDDLKISENTARMMEENARLWREIYEREYGMELRY